VCAALEEGLELGDRVQPHPAKPHAPHVRDDVLLKRLIADRECLRRVELAQTQTLAGDLQSRALVGAFGQVAATFSCRQPARRTCPGPRLPLPP